MNQLLNMNIFKSLLVVFVAFTPHVLSAKQFTDSTSLKIKHIKKGSDNFTFSIVLLSKENIILKLPTPKSLIFGYENDSAVDGFFEVYEMHEKNEIKQTPTEDYDQFNIKNELMELNNGTAATYEYKLGELYSLNIHKTYKVRLRFKVSKYNYLLNDIYSNWVVLKGK